MAGTGGRKNSHDVADYPLFTKDESLKRQIRMNLYRALIDWGGSYEEWAAAVGKSERTVRDWLKTPSRMNAACVEATCKLFGNASLDYLRDGAYQLRGSGMPVMSNSPTKAEHDRYEPDAIAEHYASLSEDDQRAVTALIQRLVRAERKERFLAQLGEIHLSLVKKVVRGEVSDSDRDALAHGLWQGEHMDEMLDEELRVNWDSIISSQKAEIEALKAKRREQVRRLKKERDQQGASSTSDGIVDELC